MPNSEIMTGPKAAFDEDCGKCQFFTRISLDQDFIPGYTKMAATIPDTNNYLRHSVQDLLSLEGRTTVITGGARGLGLAFTLAVAEVSGSVAILDTAEEPHEHFYKIRKRHSDVKLRYYRYAHQVHP